MPDYKPARPMIQGKVGDKYVIAKSYEGTYEHAIGVPLNTPQGKALHVPPGTPGSGAPDLTVVIRPDHRTVPKTNPVHNN